MSLSTARTTLNKPRKENAQIPVEPVDEPITEEPKKLDEPTPVTESAPQEPVERTPGQTETAAAPTAAVAETPAPASAEPAAELVEPEPELAPAAAATATPEPTDVSIASPDPSPAAPEVAVAVDPLAAAADELEPVQSMQVVVDEVKAVGPCKLEDILVWLHSEPPLTAEQLALLCVEEGDFEVALKSVQPSAKREGFATVPDVTWDDIGSLQDIRQELQMTILVSFGFVLLISSRNKRCSRSRAFMNHLRHGMVNILTT